MQGYKNFHLASYVWAYYLNRTDEAKMRADIETALAQAPIAKVYIENHRGRVDVDQEKLRLAKRVFEEYGIETAGGITSTVLEGERKPAIMDTFCYTDPRHRERYLNIVRELSEVFDEIILDDYFFTACRCEMCIKAKGKMSWAQYRLGLMEEFSREIVDLAHQVNPKLKQVSQLVRELCRERLQPRKAEGHFRRNLHRHREPQPCLEPAAPAVLHVLFQHPPSREHRSRPERRRLDRSGRIRGQPLRLAEPGSSYLLRKGR